MFYLLRVKLLINKEQEQPTANQPKTILVEIQKDNGKSKIIEINKLVLSNCPTDFGKIPGSSEIKWQDLQEEAARTFGCAPSDIISITYKPTSELENVIS